MIFLVVPLLCQKLGLNSRNSSKPGGQNGHEGITLQQTSEPDHIEPVPLERTQLPEGDYRKEPPEKRPVIDIDISLTVTEYQAEILVNQQTGQRFVVPFPAGIRKAVQFGNSVKAHAVYLSQYQLLPYQRIQDYFEQYLQMNISTGSLFNFNQEAYEKLAEFEQLSLR